MATVKQYTLRLWKAHATVSRKLGVDVEWGALDKRVQTLSADVMLAGILKVLTDKGVLTDTELNQVYAQITNASFPALPVGIPAPQEGVTTPDPDLGT